MGKRLDLLRGGRDAETRQQTLRATIDWSYELLEADERSLLAALSVFRGGWTLEAAEEVADADLELLQSLVDKSLVSRWESGRFGMLETIREFAAEQLPQSESDAFGRRLLEHLLAVFEDANLGPQLRGEPRIELAQAERPNVDVALAWATEAGETVRGLRLMELLETYWSTNDPVSARPRVDALVAVAGKDIEATTLAKALRLRGGTFDMTGRSDLAEQDYQRAIELLRPLGDANEKAHLTARIAMAASQQGNTARAKVLAREALASTGLSPRDKSIVLTVLSKAAFTEGDAAEGVQLAREAADAAEKLGFTWWRGITLFGASEGLLTLGDFDTSQGFFAEAVELLRSVNDLVNLPIALAAGAALAAQLGDPVRAGTLWGALEAEAEQEPRQSTIDNMALYEPYLEPARGSDFDQARARGRTLTLDDAVAYAIRGPT